MLGLTLMLGYLGADGFTSTFQDKLFRGFRMSAFNQMLYINAFSSVISAAGARCPCSRLRSQRHAPCLGAPLGMESRPCVCMPGSSCICKVAYQDYSYERLQAGGQHADLVTVTSVCWSRPGDLGADGASAGLCGTAPAGAAVRGLAFAGRDCRCAQHDMRLVHIPRRCWSVF